MKSLVTVICLQTLLVVSCTPGGTKKSSTAADTPKGADPSSSSDADSDGDDSSNGSSITGTNSSNSNTAHSVNEQGVCFQVTPSAAPTDAELKASGRSLGACPSSIKLDGQTAEIIKYCDTFKKGDKDTAVYQYVMYNKMVGFDGIIDVDQEQADDICSTTNSDSGPE